MATLQGFKIAKVAFDASHTSPHYLYFKKHTHQKQNDLTPPGKTLFVVNVPPYCTKKGLKNVFQGFGPISSVYIHDSPGPVLQPTSEHNIFHKEKYQFKVAFVVFIKSASIDKIIKNDLNETLLISTDSNPVKTGIEKWCMEYKKQYPNPDDLQKKVDKYMAAFDAKTEKEKQELEKIANQTDDEGWTLVSYGGKKLSAPAKKVTTKERKKRQKKELVNFYTFQQRESKREHIAVLRKKFEEDKKKIEMMRAARKFRPF